jgi:hypothetical protein
MTRPGQSDGRLYYLLALYAALDRAVTESGDPRVAAIVEGFLPGTTGANQRGWAGNLEEFFGQSFPDVNDALSALVAAEPPLTPLQLSKLVYVLGSLLHIPEGVEIGREQFVQGLSLAQPSERQPPPAPTEGAPDPGLALFNVLSERFHRRQDWRPATAYAVQIGCLDPVVAGILPCDACLTEQGGIQCVVVDTRCESNSVSLGQVKAILDLRNWDKTAGEFFCNMQGLGQSTAPYQDWGVVLETVSAWCGSTSLPVLKTELKYLKAQYPNGAVVQYDLNEKPPAKGQGDGLVTVDKGWLKVVTGTSTNHNAGVTITTRKVVHINPMWPVAQKIFVCVIGYGQAAEEMLLGGAQNPPPNLFTWSDPPAPLVSTHPMEAFLVASAAGTQAAQPPPASPLGDQAGQKAPQPVASGSGAVPKTAAGLAVNMLSEYLAETATHSAAIAAKFADRELTVDDVVKFSAKFGARMASEPWRFLQKLSELPPTTPTGGPTQDGDTS